MNIHLHISEKKIVKVYFNYDRFKLLKIYRSVTFNLNLFRNL